MQTIFTGFPKGFRFNDKVKAIFFRIIGCDHRFYNDIGDEDTFVPYCFKCARFVERK